MNAMNEANRKQAIKKRGIIKAGLSRIETFIDTELETADLTLIQIKLNRLRSLNEEFQTIQLDLELYDDSEDAQHDKYREEFENLYDVVESKLQAALNTTVTRNEINSHPPSVNDSCRKRNIRLPKINLPTFDGNLTTWLHYKDTFENLIIANEDLSNIERFHYLLSSLKGEAKDTIKNISISDSNFTTAYNLIKGRYHCPKLIASEYVKQLLKPPSKPSFTEPELRHLINTFQGSLDALSALNAQPSIQDLILTELLLSHVDIKLRLEFENMYANQDVITFKDLVTFLEKKCQTLQLCMPTSLPKQSYSSEPRKGKRFNELAKEHQSYMSTTNACCVCNASHKLYACPEFVRLNISDRYKVVKDNNACSNCLSISHKWKSCSSKMTCKKCNKYHHTLLHDETRTRSQTSPTANISENQTQQETDHQYSSYHSLKTKPANQVLLSTALVKIKDSTGRFHIVRAILDSGSQSNFISEKIVQQLHLKKDKTHTMLQAFGDLSSHSDATVSIEIHSNVNDYSLNIDCVVLPKITGNMPASYINCQNWNIPKDISLADPGFYKPQVTDLLIGAPVFMHLLKMERKKRSGNYPILQNTHLGWILSGSYHQPTQDKLTNSHSFFLRNDLTLETQLQKFWSIEEINHVVYSPQEKICERHFQENTKRDKHGRYTVSLPLKNDHEKLGNSKEIALQRFHLLETRFQRDKQLHQEYTNFMREYEALGHMRQIQQVTTDDEENNYYLPHHPVFKRTSSTTKTRVVFDASAKTENGLSLNDILLVGPTIQDDLCSIILRFRTKPIAFTADIEKMYRQVNISPQDYHLQCILWREDPKETLKTYTLTTVTYGTSSAPFLATRCLKQLATDEEEHFPRASIILKRDFYIDDCMSGANSIEEAQTLQSELQKLLNRGGFNLRKWCTNSQELLNSIPTHLQENQHALTNDNSDIVRTLGLIWRPSSDKFQIVSDPISCQSSMNNAKISKRFVLSRITAIFDPLGLLAPMIILCKIFMQRLWQEKAHWDDPLTSQLLQNWNTLSNQLQLIKKISIPRLVMIIGEIKSIQVHGFCDASEKAYGACIYIRSSNHEGKTSVMLLCAKSKVAPLKQITLPRLELCGAVLLARLMKKTLTSLCLNVESIRMWTDSMIVLNWLACCPTKWKTFVANRVAEIQDITSTTAWHHVPSKDNPADLISRGHETSSLINCKLWWHGPDWLKEDSTTWPRDSNTTSFKNLPEQRNLTMLITIPHNDNFITKHSNLLKLQRVIGYCLRFISNCRKASSERNFDTLSPKELDTALRKCIKIIQFLSFSKEINELKKYNKLISKSNIRNLNPILDQDDCIRVGGRLTNAPLSYEARHQIILPAHHHLTKLIIMNEHKRLLHASNHLLISSLRQRFWIPTIRQIVRKCIHSCIICRKISAKTAEQLMGNLPKERVTPSRPFTNVGLDYAGPFLIKSGNKRSKTYSKSYIALFICLATKALHLEVISDLTTNAFLAALHRFTSRRGYPSRIYSDNATNFVGANREIRRLIEKNDHHNELINATASTGMTWHFIPPSAPHFGGLWEAAVKSLKYHLRRVMGTTSLTFEEFTTLITQIEACLNSRPLIKNNDDSLDPPFLTPAHFLIGEPLTSIPEFDIESQSINMISRWQYIQQLKQHFWQRWTKEYLNTLQQRHKWNKSFPNLRPGTVVLIKDDNLPPLRWKYGIIETVHPGSDNKVRVATVRCNSTVLKRPIHKLCILPVEE